MVTVNVGDENGFNFCHVLAVSTKACECRGRCIDDMAAIEHGKRVMTAMREKGIARSQHVNPVCHGRGNASLFLFPSVLLDGHHDLSLIHISEPRDLSTSRMPSSA